MALSLPAAHYTLTTLASRCPRLSRQQPDPAAHRSCFPLCLSPALSACPPILSALWRGAMAGCSLLGPARGQCLGQRALGEPVQTWPFAPGLWAAGTTTCLPLRVLRVPPDSLPLDPLLWGAISPWGVGTAPPSIAE